MKQIKNILRIFVTPHGDVLVLTAMIPGGKHAGLRRDLPAKPVFQQFSCQHQLRTRCLIDQVDQHNPGRQGCGPDEYPADFTPSMFRAQGIIQEGRSGGFL